MTAVGASDHGRKASTDRARGGPASAPEGIGTELARARLARGTVSIAPIEPGGRRVTLGLARGES